MPVVVSHLKVGGAAGGGLAVEALRHIEAAGPSVAADQYPYTAGSTVLSAFVDGMGLGELGNDKVVIASTSDHPQWHGKTLAALEIELGVGPSEVGPAVLEAEPLATVILHTMLEEDVRTIMASPGIMIGSDGIPSIDGQPHPRLYGTFARVLGHYSRDLGVLDFADAVHRMTGRSAAVFGLVDRGEIRVGAFADLVLFDAKSIIDRATYEDPQQHSAGIVGVWVNGERVVDGSTHLGVRSGRALRRV